MDLFKLPLLLLSVFAFLFVRCSEDSLTSGDDFFVNHHDKIWIEDSMIINDNYYQLDKILLSDGTNGSSFLRNYYFEAGLGACQTFVIGENIDESGSGETYYCSKSIIQILDNKKDELKLESVFYLDCENDQESFTTIATYKIKGNTMTVIGEYDNPNFPIQTIKYTLYEGNELPGCL